VAPAVPTAYLASVALTVLALAAAGVAAARTARRGVPEILRDP
jgi:hypothetical protein